MTKLLLSVYEVASANSSAGKSRADGWEMNAMIVDVSSSRQSLMEPPSLLIIGFLTRSGRTHSISRTPTLQRSLRRRPSRKHRIYSSPTTATPSNRSPLNLTLRLRLLERRIPSLLHRHSLLRIRMCSGARSSRRIWEAFGVSSVGRSTAYCRR